VYRKGNTEMQCQNTGQELEQDRKQETGTGLNLKREYQGGLCAPSFSVGLNPRESWESVRSCDCSASRADEFRGGTSAGDVTGDVTGSELAGCVSKVT